MPGYRHNLFSGIDLLLSFSLPNFIFALLKERKGIPRMTFILVSVNKKVFLKN